MASDRRGAEVEIFGERYTLRSTDTPEYLQRVAEYVDGKFREMVKQSPSLVPSKVAVLVSVNIADELFKQNDELRRRERETLARIDGIVALLRREDVVG
jgi:cell division protein ZapA